MSVCEHRIDCLGVEAAVKLILDFAVCVAMHSQKWRVDTTQSSFFVGCVRVEDRDDCGSPVTSNEVANSPRDIYFASSGFDRDDDIVVLQHTKTRAKVDSVAFAFDNHADVRGAAVASLKRRLTAACETRLKYCRNFEKYA